MENIIKKLNKLEAKLDIIMLTLAEIALVIDNPNIIEDEDDADEMNELHKESERNAYIGEKVIYTDFDRKLDAEVTFNVIVRDFIFESTSWTSLWGYWIELPNKDIIPVNKITIKRF